MSRSVVTLAELGDFDEIIDVRSPAEYREDRIPGAINCPVLDDAQRALVGTLYKQHSPFEARRLGGALVAENIARHLKVDPGVALTRTNAKFTRRFKHVEKSMKAAGIPMDKNHLAEMDAYWDEAKRNRQ